MLKIISAFLVVMFFTSFVYAQKNFDITIKLDSSVVPQNVHYQYYNGKNIVILPDTFGNNRVVKLKGKYYSPLVSFNISYSGPQKATYYDNDFFVGEKPAVISFYYKIDTANKLNYN